MARRLMLALVAALAILALSGCSSLRAPASDAPTTGEILLDSLPIPPPVESAPIWKKMLYWGTYGH